MHDRVPPRQRVHIPIIPPADHRRHGDPRRHAPLQHPPVAPPNARLAHAQTPQLVTLVYIHARVVDHEVWPHLSDRAVHTRFQDRHVRVVLEAVFEADVEGGGRFDSRVVRRAMQRQRKHLPLQHPRRAELRRPVAL
eukprot:CAMPEP_0184730414 /NCGR_PEP_ID=MMETSP0314-20130426/47475_1 /TAXON_ID=38298 /ORGANISM="Rhodella maculata, Strain CCMP 736" /LENGTH=136 /DNA_ID=CAMNT_0027196595 /DNA_START=464 /DNA_END=870 /DNA_ORIENTATION=+